LVIAAIGVALVFFFWWKGQPFAAGDVFRASRWARGNRLFPTQVLITPTRALHTGAGRPKRTFDPYRACGFCEH
jgi:hypothetical protein